MRHRNSHHYLHGVAMFPHIRDDVHQLEDQFTDDRYLKEAVEVELSWNVWYRPYYLVYGVYCEHAAYLKVRINSKRRNSKSKYHG